MRVITCISDSTNGAYIRYLQSSCHYFGHTLDTLVHNGRWESNRLKDRMLLQHLTTVPSEEIVLCTDGYDVAILASTTEIRAKFDRFDRPLVFSSEKNCWPYPDLAKYYAAKGYQDRFLNSGGFIGRAGFITELLSRHNVAPSAYTFANRLMWTALALGRRTPVNPDRVFRWSDQYYWTHIFLRNSDSIALDSDNMIFMELSTPLVDLRANIEEFRQKRRKSSLYMREHIRISRECGMRGGRLHCLSTGTFPCHLHFNGPVAKEVIRSGAIDQSFPWLG